MQFLTQNVSKRWLKGRWIKWHLWLWLKLLEILAIHRPSRAWKKLKLNEQVRTWTRWEKFILISFEHRNRKRWLGPKHTVKKMIVWEDHSCSLAGPSQTGKVPIKSPRKERSMPQGIAKVKCTKRPCHYWPATKTLMAIRWFQKSMDLLVPKRPFYRLVREVTGRETMYNVIM